MRAIILSAGAGKRLHPLTAETPKCLLEVTDGESLLSFQLRALAACGVREATVVIGFGADQVEEQLAAHPVPNIDARTLYNPFSAFSDNLVSAWLARIDMTGDFLLLNGDALFEPAVLQSLLAAPAAPITLTVSTKKSYDDDDMKVSLEGQRLTGIGKTLQRDEVDAESIGLMLFRGYGVDAFRHALEAAVREPESVHLWYLSAINGMADSLPIQTLDVTGSWWSEVDNPEDLDRVRRQLAGDRDVLPAAAGSDALFTSSPLPE